MSTDTSLAPSDPNDECKHNPDANLEPVAPSMTRDETPHTVAPNITRHATPQRVLDAFRRWEQLMQTEQLSPPITNTANTRLGRFVALYRSTYPISDQNMLQILIDDTIEVFERCRLSDTVHSVRTINQHLSNLTLGQQENFWQGTVHREMAPLLVDVFLRMSDYLRDRYRPICTADDSRLGWWAVKPGSYEALLSRCTTLPAVTGKALMQFASNIALKAVRALEKHTGVPFRQITSKWESRSRFPEAPPSEACVLADFKKFLDTAYPALTKLFEADVIPPRESLKLNVLRFRQLELFGAAFYTRIGVNGTMNVGNTLAFFPDVFSHEGLPGHQMEMSVRDRFVTDIETLARVSTIQDARTVPSAYREGWATYVEGLLRKEFPANLQRDWYEVNLMFDILGAATTMAEIGIHHGDFRWSRDRACTLIRDLSWLKPSNVDKLVDEIVQTPGALIPYFVGAGMITIMKERARNALGNRFTESGFHQVLLMTPAPIPVVSAAVDVWVQSVLNSTRD